MDDLRVWVGSEERVDVVSLEEGVHPHTLAVRALRDKPGYLPTLYVCATGSLSSGPRRYGSIQRRRVGRGSTFKGP